MVRNEILKMIKESMINGGIEDFEGYDTLIVDRLLSKNPDEQQIYQVCSNLRHGLGVQNALVLIESF